MGENQRHDIGKTGDAAQKENERSSEGKSVGYGQGTLEEGAGRRQERALKAAVICQRKAVRKGLATFGGARYTGLSRLSYEKLDLFVSEWANDTPLLGRLGTHYHRLLFD